MDDAGQEGKVKQVCYREYQQEQRDAAGGGEVEGIQVKAWRMARKAGKQTN